MIKVKNGWKATNKQGDKVMIKIRFGIVTVFDLNMDLGAKRYSVTLFNYIFRF